MKKFVFGVFVLLTVGLFTSPLFAKRCDKVPECASGCRYMQSCRQSHWHWDIYDCGGNYASVPEGRCNNCEWNVEMKNGKFFLDGYECIAD